MSRLIVSESQHRQELLTKRTRSTMILATYNQCKPPPLVALLDDYSGNGEGACLKKFSDPGFFFDKWLEGKPFGSTANPPLRIQHSAA